jgi:hypothetical protein
MFVGRTSEIGVWVVSIRDSQEGRLSFDTGDVVRALGQNAASLTWVVNIWEWLVDEGVTPDDGPEGAILTTDQLLQLCSRIRQTQDGEFVGFLPNDIESEFNAGRPDLRNFPMLKARIGILAFDCSFFAVWTRDYKDIEAIKTKFREVVDEDVAAWCDLPPD